MNYLIPSQYNYKQRQQFSFSVQLQPNSPWFYQIDQVNFAACYVTNTRWNRQADKTPSQSEAFFTHKSNFEQASL